MAIFVPGPAIAEIRGSQGGTVFSRNRHGQYTRQRSTPVNPNSARQIASRERFNTLATYWRDTLTQAQRDGWDAYAAGTNWINGVGQVTHLTGMNHFIRSNNFYLIASQAIVTAAPGTMGIPAQEELWSHAADSAAQQITITYTFDTDVDGQNYYFYQGIPVDGSRQFFAGPWRILRAIVGDSGSPPASPSVSAAVYPIGAGQNSFVYCRRIDDDARLTQPFRQAATVT